MRPTDVVKDKKLLSILDRYSDSTGPGMGTVLRRTIENLINTEVVIPVIGMQGTGKSTLINAVIGEDILPCGCNETTCIPIEIKYSHQSYAVIFFNDDRTPLRIFTHDELRSYADNNENPSNIKNVSHAVVFSNAGILKNNVVFVDLPGAGGLTGVSNTATLRYIQSLSFAVFLLPVVPTIRKADETLIKLAWMQFSSAVFAENSWDDNRREISESVDFNKKVLEEIAQSLHCRFDNDITVINAEKAVNGQLENDTRKVQTSNIAALVDKLKSVIDNWEKTKQDNFIYRYRNMLAYCKKEISDRINDFTNSENDSQERLEAERKLFETATDELEKKADTIITFINNKRTEIYDMISECARVCCENIRSETFRVIDCGVVDGDQLSIVFNDYRKKFVSQAYSKVLEEIIEIRRTLSSYAKDFDDLISKENAVSFRSMSFNSDQTFKYEKGLRVGINIAGGLSGFVVGALIGGPAFFFIMAAALFFGGWLGHYSYSQITAQRAVKAKETLGPYLESVEKNFKSEMKDAIDEIAAQASEKLENYISERRKHIASLYSLKVRQLSLDNDKNNLIILEQDLKYICTRERSAYE
ncbi:MAG: dynamin family protein [Oscillospiraceae bacterium]|nr:dynamin family protein [Oscillospiraceae bacterium]